MNARKLTTELDHVDIRRLENACAAAHDIGFKLNTLLTFAPFKDAPKNPSPDAVAANFGRLLRHVSMWVRRNTGDKQTSFLGCPFTYLRVCHANENGSDPHLHVFMHLPSDEHRKALQSALLDVYGYHSCGLVAQVKVGSDTRIQHDSGWWGSTFDYMTRYMTQQAFVMLGMRVRRHARKDENGKHVGIKAPFVGRRWSTSRNINANAQAALQAAKAAMRGKARIAAERQRQAA